MRQQGKRDAGRRRFGGLAVTLCALVLVTGPVEAASSRASTPHAHSSGLSSALADAVRHLRDVAEPDAVAAVNRFFNRFSQRTDRDLWGRDDYWATPAELLRRRAGDCEDFALAKYFALRLLGVPDDQLELAYVRLRARQRSHMVLLYRDSPGAPAYVLDREVDRIGPLAERTDLAVIYGFNARTFSVPGPNGPVRAALGAARPAPAGWVAVNARIERTAPRSAPKPAD